MLNLTKPRYVMPAHGDFKRLRLHAELAEAVGVPPESIFQGRNGLALEIDAQGRRLRRGRARRMIFVDGVDIGEPDDVALRDRRMLSADGIFIVVATISSDDGTSVAPPEVIFRGVPFVDEADGLVEELREVVVASLARRPRARSRRSTCSRRTCTTTSPSSSTSACGAGRWCCPSWSRSESG